jgi:ribose-phosphate pyrophosphokinase
MYYSSVLGLDIGMFYKRRNYSVVVDGRNPIIAHEYLGMDVKGKDVIIIDDMIASGESILDVACQLRAKGANRIFCFASFGLFTAGLDRFDKAYAEGTFTNVFTTNLIYRTPELLSKPWYVEVNMCKYVSYIIDTINYDETISNLLNPVTRINNLVTKHRAELKERAK